MNSNQLDQFVHGKRITLDESKSSTRDYACHLDSIDPLSGFRKEFLIPSKSDLEDPHPEAKPTEKLNGIAYVPRTEDNAKLIL
jgi:kynureninase